MQTPDYFKNFEQDQSSNQNNKQITQSNPNINQNRAAHAYKPVSEENLIEHHASLPKDATAPRNADDGDISYDSDDLSYKGDNKTPLTKEDKKPTFDDELSYEGNNDQMKDDDDISYEGNNDKKMADNDDDISYEGNNNNKDKRIDDEDDDISYKGSPKKNNDASSDISA